VENLVGKEESMTTGRLISAIYTLCINADALLKHLDSTPYKTNIERI